MTHEPSPPMPANLRLIAAGMAGAAAVGLLLNHFAIESQNVARLMILGLGPIALFLGIGGAIEPKILWSVGKYGGHLPVIYKAIGGALGGLGLVVTLLLLVFVYRFGPPEPKPPRLPKQVTAATPKKTTPNAVPPVVAPSKPERRVAPQEVQFLTYDRPNKRWVEMDAAAAQGVHREDADGATTLHYAEGKHGLLKVLWPDTLEVGERFTVEMRGANSIEMVDLAGADANARASIPANDGFVALEILRERDKITFRCDGQSQKSFYASGSLRGEEAESALLAAALRPGFSIKKGERASFRNPQIVKP